MIDDLVSDLHLLQKADSLIGKIWLKVIARRFSLFMFAGLIAVFGLGMADIAGLYALQGSAGPVWAAVIVAMADFAIAAIVLLIARNSEPGPEIDLALDVRKMAIEAIKADAADLRSPSMRSGKKLGTPRIPSRDSCKIHWMSLRRNFSFLPLSPS